MSNDVTQSGIQGYEYQYKISLLIGLQQLNNDVKLFIEAVGIEDAFLKINSNGKIQNIEIQVKREKKLLENLTLTKWLCHFAPRDKTDNLLQRVIDGSIALFVTQSTCLNEQYEIKKTLPDLSSHKKLSFKQINNFRNNLISELNKLNNSLDNDLIKRQIKELSIMKVFNEVFKNVIIWHEVEDSDLDNKIETILNREFNIPLSSCSDIRRELEEVIEKKGRDLQKDVIPFIRQILQKNQPERPQLNKQHQHLPRTEEQDLIEKLSKDNVLLLTGRSFCGKSELAKKIAIHFFDKGFSYKNSDNVQALREFFGQNAKEDKIAILEDPWGHIKPENKSRVKRSINELISKLPNHHKLIITSRIEIVEEAFNNKLSIKRHNWIDLSINNNEKLITFWKYFANQNKLSEQVLDLVTQNLNSSNTSHTLQIGELEYLSNQDNLDGKTFEELVHLARQDYDEIAEKLLEENQQEADLLAVLAFCSNTIQSVSFTDLAYILHGGDKYYSIAKNSQLIRTYSFGSAKDNDDEVSFEYDKEYKLFEQDKSLIKVLKRKGYIIIDKSTIRFKHPNYYEAGRFLFTKTTSQTQTFEIYRRALYCLNSSITYLAGNQLDIYAKYVVEDSIDTADFTELVEISSSLNSSIFPATRDISLIFRINNIEKLSQKKQNALFDYIVHTDDYINNIYWYEDKPYIKNHAKGWGEQIYDFDNLNIDKIWERINNREKVSTREYFAITQLKQQVITSFVIEQLMQINEGFIRSKAALIYFSNIANINDKKLINIIFADAHPSVLYNAICGSFIGWCRYSKELKEYLFEKINLLFEDKVLVIRISRLMTNFGVDYQGDHVWHDQKKKSYAEIWNLWASLFPTFLKQFPTDIRFHAPRFSHTMDKAVEYMTVVNSVKVFEAWYDIINRDKKGQWILDHYASSIMSYLILCTKDDWIIRQELFDKLLLHSNTNFLLTSTCWAVDNWNDYLHISEKEKIINLSKSKRVDNIWIKACLICLNPSDKVSEQIFGDNQFLEQSPQYIVENMPTELLDCCLRLFYGFGRLWDLPTQGNNKEFWYQIIRYILENEVSPFFKMCFHNFLYNAVGSDHRRELMSSWEIIYEEYFNKEYLLQSLMYWNGRTAFTVSSTKYLWDVLIEKYQEAEQEDEFIQMIVKSFGLLKNIKLKFLK